MESSGTDPKAMRRNNAEVTLPQRLRHGDVISVLYDTATLVKKSRNTRLQPVARDSLGNSYFAIGQSIGKEKVARTEIQAKGCAHHISIRSGHGDGKGAAAVLNFGLGRLIDAGNASVQATEAIFEEIVRLSCAMEGFKQHHIKNRGIQVRSRE